MTKRCAVKINMNIICANNKFTVIAGVIREFGVETIGLMVLKVHLLTEVRSCTVLLLWAGKISCILSFELNQSDGESASLSVH